MSLLGTLAKVAVGIAVAKGVGGMLKKGGGAGAAPKSGGGLLGDLLSGGSSNNPGQAQRGQAQQGGGLGDLLGSVLGGQGGQGGSAQGGGLGGLLEQLSGGQGGGQGGGLGDLLGNLTGGAGGSGGIGDLLGGLLGGAAKSGGTQAGGNTDSFGDVLNQSFQRGGEPKAQPSQEHEAMAALMLRAMIQATKADGELDEQEHEKLISGLGDVSKEEMAFVNHEMQQPVDIEGLARQVPKGMEQQIYTMSVMAIDLDSQAEAQYLHKLNSALGMDQNQADMIHDELGVQRLYS